MTTTATWQVRVRVRVRVRIRVRVGVRFRFRGRVRVREELPPRQRRSDRYAAARLSAPARAGAFARVAGVGAPRLRLANLADRVEGHAGTVSDEHVGDLAVELSHGQSPAAYTPLAAAEEVRRVE